MQQETSTAVPKSLEAALSGLWRNHSFSMWMDIGTKQKECKALPDYFNFGVVNLPDGIQLRYARPDFQFWYSYGKIQ